MSIAERRVRKAIRKAQEALVAKGEPPTASAVARALARLRDPSSPALQLFRQQRRTTFNVAEHNRMLGEAHDDLEVLFEEFYAEALRSLRLLDREDLLFRRLLMEGKRANDLLEYELLTISGGG